MIRGVVKNFPAIALAAAIALPSVSSARNSEEEMEVWLQSCAESLSIEVLKDCVAKLGALRQAYSQSGRLTKMLAGDCAKESPERMRACLEIIAGAAPAVKPDAQTGMSESVWKVACSPDPKANRKVCLVQAIVGGEAAARLNYTIPSGILALSAGAKGAIMMSARLQIDDQPAVLFQHCQAGICFPALGPDPELIAKMRNGGQVRVTYDALTERSGPVDVPLAGFAEAIDGALVEIGKQ